MTASNPQTEEAQEGSKVKVSSKRLRLDDGTVVEKPVVVAVEPSKERSEVTLTEIARSMDGDEAKEDEVPAQEAAVPEEPEQVQTSSAAAVNPETVEVKEAE